VTFAKAAAALSDEGRNLVDRWLERFAASPIRIPRPFDLATLRGAASKLVTELAWALAQDGIRPGSPILRESEKQLGFLGGILAALGASAFDVVALGSSLRDLLVGAVETEPERRALTTLFEWFGAVTLDSYASSREDSLRLKHREAMERGMPVVMIARELPAAFLVGEVDHALLETTYGRLVLSIVRVGAAAVVIDATGLAQPMSKEVLDATRGLAQHPKLGSVVLIVTGLSPEAEKAWAEVLEGMAPHFFEERLDDAVSRALALGGKQIR
jgi:hypothetical protein